MYVIHKHYLHKALAVLSNTVSISVNANNAHILHHNMPLWMHGCRNMHEHHSMHGYRNMHS